MTIHILSKPNKIFMWKNCIIWHHNLEFSYYISFFLLACLQAVTGGFIAENPFRSLIEHHLGFLRRALPGTSGRAQKSREGEGEGREKPQAVFHPSPRLPPLAHIVNSLPGPDLAARIQDGDLITNSSFFRPSNRLRAGYFPFRGAGRQRRFPHCNFCQDQDRQFAAL